MNTDRYRTLQSKLQAFEQWPSAYLFKFIVPQQKLPELEALFEGHEFSTRESSGGRWVSLSCIRTMEDSEAVIEVYKKVDSIEGVYAL